MLTVGVRVAVPIVAIVVASGCMAPTVAVVSGASSSECRETNIAEILDDPFAVENEVVCTEGYFFDRGQWVLRDDIDPSRESYYDVAILLDDVMGLITELEFQSREVVRVRGMISVLEECWRDDDESDANQVTECVPFRRPIYLQVIHIERKSESQ